MCYVARVVMRNDIIFIIAYIRWITQYEIFIKNTYRYFFVVHRQAALELKEA